MANDQMADVARFHARHLITGTGIQSGREAAIFAAKGLLQGAIDELITMLGEHAAYEHVMKVSDGIVKAPVEPGKEWAPKP